MKSIINKTKSRVLRTIATACIITVMIQVNTYGATIEDRTHFSTILGMNRNFRVYLPPGYGQPGKRYPVLYWFHGSGGSSIQTTYKAEFEDFADAHDLIIVNVDGSTGSGATWDYGLAFEYAGRTQEGNKALTGMHFSRYIRELTGIIDSLYNTYPDRDHRAISGQSMGGLMSPWIASQNKDLFGSASMFSPSPDAAMFGDAGKEVCFVNSQLYRSLKGLPLRIAVARGDRYRQYYREQKALWELTDLTRLEFNEVDYPDHRAVDIPGQFNFHMKEFGRVHPVPQKWHHTDPFSQFKVWNYEVSVLRDQPALTMLEKVTPSGMLIRSRAFLPDGPIIQNEQINITTDTIYSPSKDYFLTDFNLSTGIASSSKIMSDQKGRLKFTVEGGGHALGMTGEEKGAKLYLIPQYNKEEIYCETGVPNTLSFNVVNVGRSASGPVHIIPKTPKAFLTIRQDELTISSIGPGEQFKIDNAFPFVIADGEYDNPDNENYITKISLEASCDGAIQDISDIFIYPVSGTRQITDPSDFVILDGAVRTVKYYNNRSHNDTLLTVTCGSGNGNSVPEPGETIELWVRLPQGLGQADKNTFHPTYLINANESSWATVPDLRYNIKSAEYSGAANLQSRIKIDSMTPPGTELDLWLKCESYEFSEEGFTRPIQRHTFDYRRVILKVLNTVSY